MQNEARIHLLARVARSAFGPDSSVEPGLGSILAVAAASYGSRPSGDATVPTGFDPLAIALFEAIVEAAFIVASADGRFDEEERRTFENVVVAVCAGTVSQQQIAALISHLADQLAKDGIDRRVEAVARAAMKKSHAREILRVAALLALASDDVSPVEREVLGKLARKFGLDAVDVEVALAEAKAAVAAAKLP